LRREQRNSEKRCNLLQSVAKCCKVLHEKKGREEALWVGHRPGKDAFAAIFGGSHFAPVPFVNSIVATWAHADGLTGLVGYLVSAGYGSRWVVIGDCA
jgi:hypothetical protein